MGNGFGAFTKESGSIGKSFMDMAMKNSENSALDPKTQELAYIAVLSAVRLLSGIEFHVKSAKKLGTTKKEVKSAILVGLPEVGIIATESMDIALKSYDK